MNTVPNFHNRFEAYWKYALFLLWSLFADTFFSNKKNAIGLKSITAYKLLKNCSNMNPSRDRQADKHT